MLLQNPPTLPTLQPGLVWAPLAIAIAAGGAPSAQAAEVIAGPTGEGFQIADLSDGNYRFCSDRAPSDISRVSGVCFRFRKDGSQIVGDYYYPYEGSSMCLTGRVNGNTVTGQGVERLAVNAAPPDDFSRDQLTNWRQEEFLEVGRGVAISDRPRDRKAIRYRSALLNLNNFYQYNAGTVLPPSDCFTAATAPTGPRPEPDNLRQIGTSRFYDQPVYLDEGSITPLGGGQYRYRTVIGVPDLLSETEYRLDCDNLDTVQVLRSRYYDSDGDLQEVEVVNEAVPANQDSPPSSRRYNASRYICGTDAQESDPLPDNVSYERYENDRCNFSVVYPNEMLIPQSPPTNADGREFASAAGDITMRVYGFNNSLNETLDERYQAAQSERTVTYQTCGDDFSVVSGYAGDTVFYQKTLFRNNDFKVLKIEYNRDLQPELDAIVTRIANSCTHT